MVDFGDLGAKLKANKKYLIPAAIGGGALGLLVLAQRGGSSGGGGTLPGTDAGQQPGGGAQADSGIGAAIAQLTQQLEASNAANSNAIADLVQGQAGYQDQINRAFADIVSQVNAALSASQAQVNSAIAGIPQAQATGGYGMNGLESLFAQLPAFNVPQLPNVPAQLPADAPKTIRQLAPRVTGRSVGSAVRSLQQKVSTYRPTGRVTTSRGAGRSAPNMPLRGLGTVDWSSFNRQLAGGMGRSASRPVVKPSFPKPRTSGGGGGLLKR